MGGLAAIIPTAAEAEPMAPRTVAERPSSLIDIEAAPMGDAVTSMCHAGAALPPLGRLAIRVAVQLGRGTPANRRAWMSDTLPGLLDLRAGESIAAARQVHGTRIALVEAETPAARTGVVAEFADCDGLATRCLGVVLAIRTADCLPVVISDARRAWLGAVHAGWRGTLAGITAEAIKLAIADGSRAQDLHVWVGPHIHACSYEVSPDLAAEFDRVWPGARAVVGERHLDLARVNAWQATALGVPAANVVVSAENTFALGGRYPSYRREGECRGQIVTAAWLRA